MLKFKLFLFLSVLYVLFSQQSGYSCTNFIVSKGASADGSVMISYNADAGGFMETLYFRDSASYKPGEMLDVYDWDSHKYLGKIEQVAHTYKVIGLINEWQVSLGETTFGGRDSLRDTTGLVDYGSLMQIALQRAKTAREAIGVMTSLAERYGYYSSGETFSIADPNEAWVMDMIGKGPGSHGAVWVARRVPDGYICAHANHPRIREFPVDVPENCLYAKDVIDFAIKKGYYKKSDGIFRFADIYAPDDPGELLYCEGRVWSLFRRSAPSLNLSTDYWRAVKGAEAYPLFIKPDQKLSVRDVINLMRDHFDSTEFDMSKGVAAGPYGCPIRNKPLEFKLTGDSVTKYGWERPISTQQTAFAFVSQMRSWLPREIGGIHWYGVDDNYTNVYIPLYDCMLKPPKNFSVGAINDFRLDAGFWVFNLVANIAYTKYSYVYPDIRKVQKELEDKFFDFQPSIELAAQDLYKKSPTLAIAYLSDYSLNQSSSTVDRWRDLWSYLVMKYNDGYVNNVNVEFGRTPKGVGYSQEFLKQVIRERPGYYDVKWHEKSSGGDALKGAENSK